MSVAQPGRGGLTCEAPLGSPQSGMEAADQDAEVWKEEE